MIQAIYKSHSQFSDTANREQDFEEKAGAFEYHTGKMVDSAEQTAIHGKHATKQLVDNIHTATKEVIYLIFFQLIFFYTRDRRQPIIPSILYAQGVYF